MRRLIISLVVVLLLTLATAGPAFAVAHGPNPLCPEDSAIGDPNEHFPDIMLDLPPFLVLACPFRNELD